MKSHVAELTKLDAPPLREKGFPFSPSDKQENK